MTDGLDPRRAAVTLSQRARAAHARVKRLDVARVRPTVPQWEALIALEGGRRLPPGGITTIGAHVQNRAADVLVARGYATKDEAGYYQLTEAGERRARWRM